MGRWRLIYVRQPLAIHHARHDGDVAVSIIQIGPCYITMHTRVYLLLGGASHFLARLFVCLCFACVNVYMYWLRCSVCARGHVTAAAGT